MDNNLKEKLLEKISKRAEEFHPISSVQYRMRCPICGDSQKDLKDSHLYLKVSHDPSEPILYKCFLCNKGGRVNNFFLKRLGIKSEEFTELDKQIFNRITSSKKVDLNIITGNVDIDSKQVGYIQKRLGVGFEKEDYERFKIIWDMNNIIPFIPDIRMRNTMPSNNDSISFLSEDKGTILTRNFDDSKGRWMKRSLFNKTGRNFYTIKSILDIFTNEEITVNIAEGVIDIISVYKNFNDGPNSVYMAILGSDYWAGIEHAIEMGFFGSNVTIRFYLDSSIDEKKFKSQIYQYKWLFKRIYYHKNLRYEDFGTSMNKIKRTEIQL